MYYSTQPAIAWVLNHHFYGGRHFVWAAAPFYPYREANPKSSSPYLMYADFYHPWRDDDPYDRFIASMRLSLVKGVIAMTDSIGRALASDLIEICGRCPLELFYPVVYRIDISGFADNRLDILSGSAAAGSQEILVRNLREHEFDVLFGGDHENELLTRVLSPALERYAVLDLLRAVSA